MNRRTHLRQVLRTLSEQGTFDWRKSSDAEGDDPEPVMDELRLIARISEAHNGLALLDSRHDLRIGSTWGALRILARIGSGADGTVFRARDERLDREVALKILKRSSDSPRISDALGEARLLARVRHRNVVTIHGADVIDSREGIWMELLQGETLQEWIGRSGPCDAAQAAQIGAEVCYGVASIHAAGVLHRDIKAQNVMREHGGRIVVMDFSVSHSRSAAAAPGIAGTPLYLAPEVLMGAAPTVTSDIYSIGVLLYHLMTAGYPHSGHTVADVVASHQSGRRPLHQPTDAESSRLFAIIDRALQPDPGMRQQTANELERDLRSIGAESRHGIVAALRSFWAVAAALILLTLTTLAVVAPTPSGPRSRQASPVIAHPWVLIAAFENRSGNPQFDGALEYAIERELVTSDKFHLVSRPRIDDALRLMRQPIATTLDQGKAREVALRDGRISKIIAGRVETVSGVTVLSASIMDVSSGATLKAFSEQLRDPRAISAAVRALAERLRVALGESAPGEHQSGGQLERVTTPSLQALRLYSESYAAGERDNWAAAMALAANAIKIDPTFAAAHIWYAWTMRRNGIARGSYLELARNALELSGSTTDWEKLWIEGSVANLNDDDDRAMAAYAALLRLYPDHLWATSNLSQLYEQHGHEAQAIALALRLAELRPNDYDALYIALDRLAGSGNLDAGLPYARRIRETGIYDANPSGDAWIYDAMVAWHHDDPQSAIALLRAAQAGTTSRERELRDAIRRGIAMAWLALGRPTDANETLNSVLPNSATSLIRAAIAHEAGDFEKARTETLSARPSDERNPAAMGVVGRWAVSAWLLARTGAASDARQMLPLASIAEGSGPAGTQISTILKAEVAAASGNSAETIRQATHIQWSMVPPRAFFPAREIIADAHVRQGDLAGAIALLEPLTAMKHRAIYYPAIWWMRCQVRLAELYKQAGRTAEAHTLARQLDAMLSAAESGFPLSSRIKAVLSN